MSAFNVERVTTSLFPIISTSLFFFHTLENFDEVTFKRCWKKLSTRDKCIWSFEKVNRVPVSFPFLCWRVELTSSHCELPCQDATWRCTPERTLFTDSFAFYKAHEPLPLHKPVILTKYKIFFAFFHYLSFHFERLEEIQQFWHSIDIYITDDKIIIL